MKIFQKYADYYNLFYKEKDYKGECDFLEKIFRKYSKKPIHSVLDLGCGTGGHALILAKRGYKMTGADLSPQMIKLAKVRAKKKKIKIDFIQGDIRKINLKKKFDAVISMFAVIGYLTSKKDLISTFKKVGNHLEKDGLFTFDCWSGSAVLRQRPEKRIKIFEQNNEKIVRIATPFLDTQKQIVKVEYEIIRASKGKVLEEFQEGHKMRYFFSGEIEKYLKAGDLQLLKTCSFMKLNKKPTVADWNITVIAKKL